MESHGTESCVFPVVFPTQTIELQRNGHKNTFLVVIKLNEHEHQCNLPFFLYPRSVPTFICRGMSTHLLL